MAWDLFAQHLVSGFLPMPAVLLVWFAVLWAAGRRQTLAHGILAFVFCFDLFGILTMTGIWWLRPFAPKFGWSLFVGMLKSPVESALNVVLFMPLGFLLPLLDERFERLGRAVLVGFLLSLSVELVQMFGCGSTDINDLVTNTLGTCLGYGLFLLARRALPRAWLDALRARALPIALEPVFFWTVSLLIMTLVQPHVFHKLF